MPNITHQYRRRLLVLALGIILSISGCRPKSLEVDAPTHLPTNPEGVFYVHPEIMLGKVSPLVYGVNHGPWAIITDQTLGAAREAGITMIRYPGGNWGDENNLRPYHIDQFALLADQMNSQLSINVRLFKGTSEEAAELVKYANHEQNYAIKYWGIGNEPSLFATARGVPDYGVEQFNREWRATAEAMKLADPTILLIGPELHQFGSNLSSTPKDPFGLDWMTEFLKANGDLVDIVSIHRYPFPQGRGGRAATIDELVSSSGEWDSIIPYLRALIIENTGREIPIAVTEINSHWSNATGGEATPDTFYNAIWWADVLGRLIYQQVDIINYFSLQSNASIGGYGLFSRSDPRPTYYIYKMYQEFGENLVYAGCDDPRIGIYAALDKEDVLTVMMVNLGADDLTRPLVLEGKERTMLEIWQFDKDHSLEKLEMNESGGQESFLLPGYSVTLLKFK
jgi:hypothetical protein